MKDEIEEVHTIVEDKEQNIIRISLEEATQYVDTKIEMTKRISRGVILCVYSVVPLLFLLAMAEGSWIDMTPSLAIATGLVLLLILVSFGVSYFIRSNQYEIDFTKFEEEEFELEYGVRGIYKKKAQTYRDTFNRKMSISLSMLIMSAIPLLLAALLGQSTMLLFLTIVVLLLVAGIGIYLMIPVVAENTAYNLIISEGEYSPKIRKKHNALRSLEVSIGHLLLLFI